MFFHIMCKENMWSWICSFFTTRNFQIMDLKKKKIKKPGRTSRKEDIKLGTSKIHKARP